jgi:putative nucleotidyltransferase with HDIG domain
VDHEVARPSFLPISFWRNATKKLITSTSARPETIDYLIGFFANEQWNLEEDQNSVRHLRHQVGEKVVRKITTVLAGTVIIRKGDLISPTQVAMIEAMNEAQHAEKNPLRPESLLGSLLLSCLFTLLFVIYLHYFHPSILASLQKITLLVSIIILSLVLAKTFEYFLFKGPHYFFEFVRYPLLIPFTAILISILFDVKVSLFVSCVLTILMGISLGFDSLRFLCVNAIGLLMALLSTRALRRRKEILKAGLKIWVALLPVFFAFQLYEERFFSPSLVYDINATLGIVLFTVIAVLGILLFLETFFDIMTNFTLMEFMDPNHELLRRLSLEAPGTYQHCLVVGNLAEAAARTINANGLFCKVATLYHDIGKLMNPHYFSENQQGEFDIHQLLTPQESAQVIIAHVAEGESFARKYKLPESFIDIIKEHHGTTLVSYFYHKQIEIQRSEPEVDAKWADQKHFRYSGPKPHTKESAIMMIADSVEAASRSLEEVTEQTLSALLDKLISDRVKDGQFDECQLTFEELGLVKRSLLKTLLVSCHLRIKYPDKIVTVQIPPSIKNLNDLK